MSEQSFDFTNRTGQEMFNLLAQRASEELSTASGFDRYTAMLLASLIPVAEVLRDPTAQARDQEHFLADMTTFISRRLRALLEPVLRED